MAIAADIEVPVADGAIARVCVVAPEGVTDGPGTPFGLTYEPTPVVALGFSGAGELEPVCAERSVALVSREGRELEAADIAEVMSRLGATQAHLIAAGDAAGAACSFADGLPYRALSCGGLDGALERIARSEPARRHRSLVRFEGGEPVVLEGPADILVRKAVAADEPAIQAMYEHLLDACDVPGAQTCGWKRGFWPLPDDVSRRLSEGTTWVAVERASAEELAPVVLGAMSLDSDFGLPGTDPGWEPLGEGEFLTCHLLASDPSAQGRGVATSLLAAYAREGLRRGCKALRINTSPQSLSNRLYRELGFVLHTPQWFPYEGLDLTGWTNVYQIWLEA